MYGVEWQQGQNCRVSSREEFSLEAFFKWFFCTYCHLVRCKVWKKTFEQILDITLKFTKVTFIKLLPPFKVQHLIKKTIMYILRIKDVRLTSGQNCPFLTKDNFWENLTNTIFINLCSLLCCKARERSLEVDPGRKASLVLADNQTKIELRIQKWLTYYNNPPITFSTLVCKRLFQEILFKWFLSTDCALSCCKAWKTSLQQILRLRLA